MAVQFFISGDVAASVAAGVFGMAVKRSLRIARVAAAAMPESSGSAPRGENLCIRFQMVIMMDKTNE